MCRLQLSNLTRQFLFREHNVGHAKSVAAAAAVKAINPDFNVLAMQHVSNSCARCSVAPVVLNVRAAAAQLVHAETESVFNSAFWAKLDFVTNALDNLEARKYVDSRCVLYGKALLESGTLGTMANVMVILPHLTASYSDGADEKIDEVAMCTLRNFPSQIEHCIEWARAKFHDYFVLPFKSANACLKDVSGFAAAVRAKVSAPEKIGDKVSCRAHLSLLDRAVYVCRKRAREGLAQPRACRAGA